MQNNNTTSRQSNKTINLSRAIMMLVKNVDYKRERTLLPKIETACYELIDVSHNDETKIKGQLSYIHDLMIMARQVNLFLEENTVFIIGVINEMSRSLETKLEVNNEEIINEKIRDILEGGEMSETDNDGVLELNNGQQDVKKRPSLREGLQRTEGVTNSNIKNENKKTDYKKTESIKDINKFPPFGEGVQRTEGVFNKIIKKEISVSENNRKLSRREEVLKVLSHVPVSIKDVSDKVLGCSEKTLQRELNTLVDLKLAARIGEKRWSRYVLA